MRSLSLALILVLALGCDDPEAPPCLMRAGDWVDVSQSLEDYPKELTLEGHMDVAFEFSEQAGIELIWSGPENVLAHRWWEWDEEALILGHEDRCQWMRDLGENVQLKVRSDRLPNIVLRGQGTFRTEWVQPQASLVLDAYAYAGYVHLDCTLDSLTVRLHAGASVVQASGDVGTLSLFASGLSSLDAGEVDADRAFVNQSAHPPVSFRAADYAYVALNSHGNVYGGATPPTEFAVVQAGSGALIWED